MDSPFRSWYARPTQQRRSFSYHPSLFGVPVYPVDPTPQARHSAYADGRSLVEKKPGQKVVQIPVQFFSSDSDRRAESALRIQKVFRGYFVRKCVRKIKEIKSQVDEIEARLLRDEVVEMIRGNERERLKMSESLMNLLLRLDGIRGIDLGIRVCRKGVTRKAITLQEKIDAISLDSEGNVDAKVETGSQELEDGASAAELVGIEHSPENGVAAELEGSRLEENSETSNDFFEQILDDSEEESNGLNSSLLECEKMEVERDSVLTEALNVVIASEANPCKETRVETEMETSKYMDFDEDNVDSVKEMLVQYNGKDMMNGEGKDNNAIGKCEFLANSGFPIASEVEMTPETCPVTEGDAETVKEMLAHSDDFRKISCDLSEESKGGDTLEAEDKTMEVEREHLDAESVDVPVDVVKETTDDLDFGVERAETKKEKLVERNGEKEDLNKRKCELLEQMMEENKKMMLMMTQLYDRNETQLQMLDALTNRVDLLEKAYLCDKLRSRRKKMKKNKCALTCIED